MKSGQGNETRKRQRIRGEQFWQRRMKTKFLLLCFLIGTLVSEEEHRYFLEDQSSALFLDIEWTSCVGIFLYNGISPSGPIQNGGQYLINMCQCEVSVQFSYVEYFHSYNNPVTQAFTLPGVNNSNSDQKNWVQTASSNLESPADQTVSGVIGLEGTVQDCVITKLQTCVKLIAHSQGSSRYLTWAYNRCDKDVVVQYFCGHNGSPTSISFVTLPAWNANTVTAGTVPNNGKKLSCSWKPVVWSVTSTNQTL